MGWEEMVWCRLEAVGGLLLEGGGGGLGEFSVLAGWVGERCEGGIRPTVSRGLYEVSGALEWKFCCFLSSMCI